METRARIKYFSVTLDGADLIMHIEEPSGIEDLMDKDIRLKLTQWRNVRSLNANAYFHLLNDKLADAMRMSKPKMKNLLLFRYGQKSRDKDGNLAIIKTNADEDELLEREDFHCWPIQNAPDGTPMYVLLDHSRFFDTHQMSVLIDGVVDECRKLNISTLTPGEIEEMKQKWGVEVG
jgi:hypothetical protein